MNIFLAVRTVMWQENFNWLLLISTVQVGDASQDHNSSSTARLRRRSRTPSSQCDLAPNHTGGLEEFQENGLMSAAS